MPNFQKKKLNKQCPTLTTFPHKDIIYRLKTSNPVRSLKVIYFVGRKAEKRDVTADSFCIVIVFLYNLFTQAVI